MTYIVIPSDNATPSISITDLIPITDGTFPGVGEVGEQVVASNAVLSSTNLAATGVWGYAHSISLDAGLWEIQGIAEFAENSAVLTDSVGVGISDDTAGATFTYGDYSEQPFFLTGNDFFMQTPVKRVSIAATTTYYLNTKLNYTSGSPQHAGVIWAKRYG
jgi:hypothetical protein